jgi:hypothetical protein
MGRQLGWLGPLDRSAGLLLGRTRLSGTVVSLVGGDPGVPVSHRHGKFLAHRPENTSTSRLDQREAARRSPSFFVPSPKMTLSLATTLHNELPITPT